MMKVRAALLAALAMMCAPRPATAAWHVATSKHFVVYANQSREQLGEFAMRLERFDAALRTLFSITEDPEIASRRVTIFVLDNQTAIEDLSGRRGSGVAGFYKPLASGSVAFVPEYMGYEHKFALSPEQVLLHEYAHHFTYEHWSEVANPLWFVEGFAEFTATATQDRDGSVTIGAAPMYRARAILAPTMPISRVLEVKQSSLKSREDDDTLYGRGWLLTHYLMMTDAHRQQLQAYIAAIQKGQTPLAAGAAIFGDLKKLDDTLDRYAVSSLHAFVIDGKALSVAPIDVQPLSDGAAAAMPAIIRTRRGVTPDAAEKVVVTARKVAAAYPQDPVVLAELAEAELDSNHPDAALAAARDAVTRDPKSVRARLLAAMATMQIAQGSKDPVRWKEARSFIFAANRLDPDNAPALRLYYATFVQSGEQITENAEDGLLRAYDIAPFDLGLKLDAARLMLRRKDVAGARTAIASIAYNPHAGKIAVFANDALTALDEKGVDAALAMLNRKEDEPTDQDD